MQALRASDANGAVERHDALDLRATDRGAHTATSAEAKMIPRFRSLPSLLVLAVVACSEGPLQPAPAADASGSMAESHAGRTLLVRSRADAGAGSLREALEQASADASVRAVKLQPHLGKIVLSTTLEYTGSQSIDIDGAGAVIDAGALADGNGMTLAAHRSVVVRRLAIEDAPGVGLAVLVPAAATGEVSVTLDDVVTARNGLHGVLVNDQTEYLADPASTSNEGSPASLRVKVSRSRFISNGFSLIDSDGLRVNEGGAGDLVAEMEWLHVFGNGGDGVELDERGEGDADFRITHSELLRNGSFTAEDWDDGIDVDEMDGGDLKGWFLHVKANDNFEQGVDLNENGAGNLVVSMQRVEGSRNAEEGIEFEEDDDVAGGGDIVAVLSDIRANGNGANDGDAGLKIREKGDGNVDAQVSNVEALSNAIGGIQVREDAAGTLVAKLTIVRADSNGDHGIVLDENGNGDLSGEITLAAASHNASAGVHAEQATAGSGTLVIRRLKAIGNPDGEVEANPAQVLVTRQP
jgi:hypothetical protein